MGLFDCFMTITDGANNNSSITAFWGLICFCTLNSLFIDVCFKVTLMLHLLFTAYIGDYLKKPPNRVMAILLWMSRKNESNSIPLLYDC